MIENDRQYAVTMIQANHFDEAIKANQIEVKPHWQKQLLHDALTSMYKELCEQLWEYEEKLKSVK